jgi:hypothetical protein
MGTTTSTEMAKKGIMAFNTSQQKLRTPSAILSADTCTAVRVTDGIDAC